MYYLPIKTNNPFGLKQPSNGGKWDGSMSTLPNGHAIFEHEEAAVRAFLRTIWSKYDNGKDTLKIILTEYAPKSDGNKTDKYIQTIANWMSVHPTTKLVLYRSKVPTPKMLEFMYALVQYETMRHWLLNPTVVSNGQTWYLKDFVN